MAYVSFLQRLPLSWSYIGFGIITGIEYSSQGQQDLQASRPCSNVR